MADETTPAVPAPEQNQETSVADNQTNTNQGEQTVQAPPQIDLGLTAEQAERFKRFMDNNGGFNNAFKKLKTDVSTTTEPEKPAENTQAQVEKPAEVQNPTSQQYQAPAGSISAQDFLQYQYFKTLAGEEKYAPIAKEIVSGSLLKEMGQFGIQPINQDGSINDEKVRMYLDLKAQTVPAQPTETEPNASAAPTVDYVEVGDAITDIDQAYKVIMQPGHPKAKLAEEFIANTLNPDRDKNKK